MYMKKQASNKINEILNSLDGIKKIQAPDFFYTRLRAKMLARRIGGETSPPVKQHRILRPVYVIAFLAVLIAFNLLSLLKNNSEESSIQTNESENSQTIASAYHFDDNLTYDLNQ